MPARAADRRVPFSYRALKAWARLVVSLFYRRVDVTGKDRLAAGRPAILAANHGNALGDVAVIVAKLPIFPHFLAAATWWRVAPARLLFRLGGAVPIHRRRDSDPQQNASTFEACHAALAEGAQLVIFPEGELHLEPGLLPLKTGAARIALGAAANAKIPGILLVPIGLVYADRARFRSEAELHIGAPIEVDSWVDRYREDPVAAVRAVTQLLVDRLRDVTVNHESRDEFALVERAAALADADGSDPSAAGGFARRNALRRALASSLSAAGGATSSGYRALATAVDVHARHVAVLGADDHDGMPALGKPSPAERVRLIAEIVALAPLAAIGVVSNGPMVLVVRVGSAQVRNEAWRATAKGLGASLLCPVGWAVEYVLIARRFGRRPALLTTAAGMVGGLAWIACHARWSQWRRIVWRERMALERPDALEAARASRGAARDQIAALLGETRARPTL